MFGFFRKKQAEPLTPDAITARLHATVSDHLSRVRRSVNDATCVKLIDEAECRFAEVAAVVGAMVLETLNDRKLHTHAVSGGGSPVWLLVTAVPASRSTVADFFLEHYPPGYGGYMNHLLNSPSTRINIAMGCSVFAHVLVYADSSSKEVFSVGFGLSPLDTSNLGACPKLVMPDECLGKGDKQKMSAESSNDESAYAAWKSVYQLACAEFHAKGTLTDAHMRHAIYAAADIVGERLGLSREQMIVIIERGQKAGK